jgi:hypothetical protein
MTTPSDVAPGTSLPQHALSGQGSRQVADSAALLAGLACHTPYRLEPPALLAYSKPYKVWTYELFQRPIQDEDAWTENARFVADKGRASATVEER